MQLSHTRRQGTPCLIDSAVFARWEPHGKLGGFKACCGCRNHSFDTRSAFTPNISVLLLISNAAHLATTRYSPPHALDAVFAGEDPMEAQTTARTTARTPLQSSKRHIRGGNQPCKHLQNLDTGQTNLNRISFGKTPTCQTSRLLGVQNTRLQLVHPMNSLKQHQYSAIPRVALCSSP